MVKAGLGKDPLLRRPFSVHQASGDGRLQIYFKVVFDTDGSIGTAPVSLFTITAFLATKETVSKVVS